MRGLSGDCQMVWHGTRVTGRCIFLVVCLGPYRLFVKLGCRDVGVSPGVPEVEFGLGTADPVVAEWGGLFFGTGDVLGGGGPMGACMMGSLGGQVLERPWGRYPEVLLQRNEGQSGRVVRSQMAMRSAPRLAESPTGIGWS